MNTNGKKKQNRAGLVLNLYCSWCTTPNWIIGQEVERVKEYKYLGVVFDEKLDWSKNSITIQKKKIHQRLFFMKFFFLLM